MEAETPYSGYYGEIFNDFAENKLQEKCRDIIKVMKLEHRADSFYIDRTWTHAQGFFSPPDDVHGLVADWRENRYAVIRVIGSDDQTMYLERPGHLRKNQCIILLLRHGEKLLIVGEMWVRYIKFL